MKHLLIAVKVLGIWFGSLILANLCVEKEPMLGVAFMGSGWITGIYVLMSSVQQMLEDEWEKKNGRDDE